MTAGDPLVAISGESCPVQKSCGGCPQLSRARPEELSVKVAAVQNALLAAGVDTPVADLVPPDSLGRFGYRNRLRMKVIDGRADFFNQAKRDGCPVVRADLWAAVQQLRALTAENRSLLVGVDHLEVRVGDTIAGEPFRTATGDVADPLIGLALSSSITTRDRAALCDALGPAWAVADPSIAPPPTLRYLVVPQSNTWVEVPVTAFVQVNSRVNQQLVAEVLEVADRTGASTFLDLFSGAGNFSVPLVASGRKGTAVEQSGDAIEALARYAAGRSDDVLRYHEGDARSMLPQLKVADLVIADPPRAGLLRGYGQLAQLVGDVLVLIGCNVSSFANDVAAMVGAGLSLESVKAFDMFPGTNHVETFAVLRNVNC